jgi:alcohol dehydrogenase class IV
MIVYDVELTYGLPPGLSLVSGINAIAHAVEAMYAREANPVISSLAEQGIAALGRALPRIVSDPADRDARSDALFGAWACGSCLERSGCRHHELLSCAGRTFGLPHAETHTVIYRMPLRINDAAPAALDQAARLANLKRRARCLIAALNGGPTSLR